MSLTRQLELEEVDALGAIGREAPDDAAHDQELGDDVARREPHLLARARMLARDRRERGREPPLRVVLLQLPADLGHERRQLAQLGGPAEPRRAPGSRRPAGPARRSRSRAPSRSPARRHRERQEPRAGREASPRVVNGTNPISDTGRAGATMDAFDVPPTRLREPEVAVVCGPQASTSEAAGLSAIPTEKERGNHARRLHEGSPGGRSSLRPSDPPLEPEDAPFHLHRARWHLHHRPAEDAGADRRGARRSPARSASATERSCSSARRSRRRTRSRIRRAA